MGDLNYFDLNKYIESHKVVNFIETGLGGGAGLSYARRFPFKRLFSIEYIESIYTAGKEIFSEDPRVTILLGTSVEQLPNILKELPQEEPILFWLDAHYPGADYKLGTHKDFYEKRIKFPLIEELDIITLNRPLHNDIIICDDYRIYYKDAYENGCLPDFADPRYNELKFPDNYTVEILKNHEGYLVLKGKIN